MERGKKKRYLAQTSDVFKTSDVLSICDIISLKKLFPNKSLLLVISANNRIFEY
jgi:hypothetical protein